MSEAAKAWLKASDKGSYYKQAALLDTEEESDRPGDPSEKSASPNTASHSYSKLQQHLDSSAKSASNTVTAVTMTVRDYVGGPTRDTPSSKSGNKARVVCVCVCVCVCVFRTLPSDVWWHAAGCKGWLL